jgi:Tfp pilus assembly protein FimT
MLVRERQAGFMLGEVLLVLALLMIIGAHAVPKAAKFFRQTAVEYEAEKLLSTIRYCQNLSRTTADNAWGYGAKNPNKRDIYLQLSAEGNQIFAQVQVDPD